MPVTGGKERRDGRGVTGHYQPVGREAALGEAGVAGEIVHVQGVEMGVECEVGEDGFEVEVSRADVKGKNAVGGEFFQVERERFAGD